MRRCSMAVQSSGVGCSGNIHNHFGLGSDDLETGNAAFPKDRRDLFLLEIGSAENPANRGTANLQPARDFGLADASAMQFSHLAGMDSCCDGPPQPLAVLPGMGQTGAHPFPQDLAFKPGENGQ